ncbi:MAG: aminotransferase class I/II-fold pyridoxal phosphate-dependent enzyme [Dehalococcoidales bacterium]|nr:aminotransferase class I/II-fold pyridoxal phosphate-dependent enzyme [Dehalococcoidales bacterium]
MPVKKETVTTRRLYREPRPMVQKAIILAAGVGNRLSPFTDRLPKCLVQVNDIPILVNTLTHLADCGIDEAVIVVGHLKEMIVESIGTCFRGMSITYVESDCYTVTNNIYSLWLAREHLTEDVLLLEADVYFEREVIDRLLHGRGENRAAVARHQSWMSGSVVRLDDNARITTIIGSSQQGSDFDYADIFKTVNIYRLGGSFLRDCFLPRLNAAIASGNVHDYYESVFTELCSQDGLNMTAVHCDDVKWIEIDHSDDLAAAHYLFASQEQRYEHISTLHGDYWRYDFVDHALLYNLHFSTEAILNEFLVNLPKLALNYPGGHDIIAGLTGNLIDQPPERIVVGNGASELIKIIGGRLTRQLIVPVPSFNEWINVVPKDFVTESALEPPSFQLDVERFAYEAFDSQADIAVIVNPNNPTSLALFKDDLTWLVRKLALRDIMLIVDESFIDFMDDAPAATMEDKIGRYQNLAVIKSLSKCYGIGGLRLGYLLTDNSQFARAVRKELPIWNINGFAEMFLRLAPRFRKDFALSCELVAADRTDFYRGLCTIPGLIPYKPEANFVFCRLPDDVVSAPELTRTLFIEENILVKHCAGKTMPEADRYLRIACRTRSENRVLIEALRRVLRLSQTGRAVTPFRS